MEKTLEFSLISDGRVTDKNEQQPQPQRVSSATHWLLFPTGQVTKLKGPLRHTVPEWEEQPSESGGPRVKRETNPSWRLQGFSYGSLGGSGESWMKPP